VYDLTLPRAVCDGLQTGHPWVFRDKLGRPPGLPDGAWVRLLDPAGKTVGTGLYQEQGGVAVRLFRSGRGPVDAAWIKRLVEQALNRRVALLAETNAYRAINGESDGLPGIVVDVYAGVGVLQTYAPALDAVGRYVGGLVARRLQLQSLLWKAPSTRVGTGDTPTRVLRGSRPYVVRFEEGDLRLAADLYSGQKSGTYLDLRGLRRYLSQMDLRGRRVLNLFSYTGAIGLACAMAGAREVVNVDQAAPALEFGRRYHAHKALRWVQADIFQWLEEAPREPFDLIIVDPPSMAANRNQAVGALKTYHRLYSSLASRVKPGGCLVACCCTSRITRKEFEEKVSYALRPMQRIAVLPMELDHHPGIPEADYLKVMVFQRSDRAVPRAAGKKKGQSRRKPRKSKR